SLQLTSIISHLNPRDLHSFPTRRSSDLVKYGNILTLVFVKQQLACVLPHRKAKDQSSYQKAYGLTISLSQLVRPLFLLPSPAGEDRKSTRLNSSHVKISYAVFCLKKKKQ